MGVPLPPAVRVRVLQLLRYGAVSAIATTTSMIVLGTLIATRTTTAGWANVIATAVGTVPSFELNRRWVWGRGDRPSVVRQVVPFTVMSFLGLAVSTVGVSVVASFADGSGYSDTTRTVLTELASLGAFGSLWFLQFVILDRVLFRSDRRVPKDGVTGPVGVNGPGSTKTSRFSGQTGSA